MTKIHTKLLVFFSVLVCSLCLCFGLTACDNKGNTGGHTHTFGGFWLFDGADGHYRLATCHPEVKSELEPHVDQNGDFKCDICDYVMHVHVDENDNNICDDCQTVLHKHTFEDEWSFNENKHWHEANCEHFIERSDYTDHRFMEGVCECGVKENEVKVYALYKKSPEYDLYFTQWLAWLENEGIISVEYTASGDGVYHYADRDEVRFVGERTVKVKAQSNGEPLANVWFMVTLYTDNEYYQTNGTIALGIAKTNESGIAEIAFSPVGGYSTSTIEYRIRIALADDVAVELGIDEKDAKPVPNRYTVNNTSEYFLYEVNENSSTEDIAATVNFTFSKGWNAYDTILLPYKRYYQDLINGTGVKEEGKTYEFTASGENLFDYFILEPAKYSFASSGSIEDSAKIEANAKIAASGVYKIYFSAEGNANVTLYYWDENGVNMSAYHQTKSDGTPSDDYITSISGGTAGSGKYTGGNYVNVTITPANGLRQYQFGIISDASVKITFTVERTGDYEERRNDGKLGVGEVNSVSATLAGNGGITPIDMDGVPAGLYTLTVTPDDASIAKSPGLLGAYTDDANKTSIWDSKTFIGIIKISANAEKLYVENMSGLDIDCTLMLEQYILPELEEDTWIFEPASNAKSANNATDITFNIPLGSSVKSGSYYIEVVLYGALIAGKLYKVTVIVGDREYRISTTQTSQYYVTYGTFIEITDEDSYITITNSNFTYNTFISHVKLYSVINLQENTKVYVDMLSTESNERYKYFDFTATRAGTYKITMLPAGDSNVKNISVLNAITGKTIIENVNLANVQVDSLSGTFDLEEGEKITLKLKRGSVMVPKSVYLLIEYEN